MKTIQSTILFTCILFWSLNLEAQKKFNDNRIEQTSFIKHIGDKGIDRGVTVEEITDVGYILTGYTTGSGAGKEDVLQDNRYRWSTQRNDQHHTHLRQTF